MLRKVAESRAAWRTRLAVAGGLPPPQDPEAAPDELVGQDPAALRAECRKRAALWQQERAEYRKKLLATSQKREPSSGAARPVDGESAARCLLDGAVGRTGPGAAAAAMFRALRAPPPYRIDLAHHEGLHTRMVLRGLKRRAATQLKRETMMAHQAEGNDRITAAKRTRKALATRPAPVSQAEQERRQAAARARAQERQQVREVVRGQPELALIRSPHAPTVADMNRFAEARLAAAAGVPCTDAFMQAHLVCSPKRDGDATTRAVRDVQAGAADSDADCDALWFTGVARVAFGTERFVRRLGLPRPATFEQYVEACVGAAVAVALEGYHACTDAYTAGRLGWNDERAAWRMCDDAAAAGYLREKHEARFVPVAEEAWRARDRVRDAVRAREWTRLLEAVRGGPFMGLQRALDLVGSPVLPEACVVGLDDFCPLGDGAVQGLKRVYPEFAEAVAEASTARLQEIAQPFLRRCRDELNAGLAAEHVHIKTELGRWTLKDAEHWLCECNKYCRTVLGEKGCARSRLRCPRGIGTQLGGAGGDTRAHPR